MKIRLRLYIYLLILVGILLYTNSLTNSFIGDDFDQIVKNTTLLHPINFAKFFTGSTFYGGSGETQAGLHYRPLMIFFYSIIYSLFGLKPIFFHLLQLFFHTTNAILIFLLFRFFFKNYLAFFLTLLFLVHPINNETVVYIANLQDTLYLFFGLIAILLVQAQKIKTSLRKGTILGLLLLLSLFSKETGILFSLIIILQMFLLKKIPLRLALLSTGIPIIIYSIVRFILAGVFLPTQAIAPIYKASIFIRLLNIPEIIFYYLKTFFYPVSLTTTQFWINTKPNLNNFVIPLLVIISLSTIFFLTGKKLRKNKKSFSTFIFFLVWTLSGLIVHSQIIPLEMTVADRWFYFTFIGAAGLLGIAIEQIKYFPKHPKASIIFTVILILLLSSRSFIRNMDWKDPITLYEHDIKVDKNNFFLENSLASEYLLKGKYQKAKPHVKHSLTLYPYFGNLNNMAVISSHEGNKKKTKIYLEKAIQIDNNYIVTENYAKFLYTNDSEQITLSFIKQALNRYPNNATLWMIRGLAENKLGNSKKAIEYTKKAYELSPNELTKSTYDGIKGIIIKPPNNL